MRLRNKKTGKKFDLSEDVFIESPDNGRIQVKVILENGNVYYYYDSLAEFNEEWEDYKPTKPLIKDEEIISFISMLERIDRKLSKLCGEEEE